MTFLRSKIHRALAYVHAAIESGSDEPLRDAELQAADVLHGLRDLDKRPELQEEVAQLTSALRTLEKVLATQSPANG